MGSELLFAVYLATLMVPSQVILIPLFRIAQKLHLLNTYLILALPVVNAFGVFLIRQFITSVPDDLIEAARDRRPQRIPDLLLHRRSAHQTGSGIADRVYIYHHLE